MIGIGNQYGGPEHLDNDCPICLVLNGVMKIAADLRDPDYDCGAKSWINPIFIVPGSVSKPDFEGLRLGHFSKLRKGLVIIIAVPELVAMGKEIPKFVLISLRQAAQMAAVHFHLRGIDFSIEEAERFIARIEARLTGTEVAGQIRTPL